MTPQPQPAAPPPSGRADAAARTALPHHRTEPRSGVDPASHAFASRRIPMRYPLVSQLAPLGALLTAPGCARAHLRDTLAEWDMTAYQEVAELLTSELVSNAVLASTNEQGHPIYVNGHLAVVVFRMLAYPNSLVLEAWDLVPTPPVMRQVGVWDESGRGLLLVDTLAQRWDWKTVANWPGKCVWAELRAPRKAEA